MTEVSNRGNSEAYKEKENHVWPFGGHSRWLRDLLELFVLDTSFSWHPFWCRHFLLIRFVFVISESWQPFLLTALLLLSWNWWLFSRFLLTSLFLDIPVFGHIFFLKPSFLHPVVFTVFWDFFLLKLFPLKPETFCLVSLHKALPTITLYYKPCTKYFPVLSTVLLRTTKLAQSTPRHYFVLQSLHKLLSRTTSYYKGCTKYCTSQYYCVLQRLHKALSSSTLRYRTSTKCLPVLCGDVMMCWCVDMVMCWCVDALMWWCGDVWRCRVM